MPLVLKDRVKETSTTTGTGTLTLGGAASGFQSFAVIGDGNSTYYAIFDRTSQDWEVGLGTYTSSGTTLSRDTVLESSNGGSLVNFGAGAKDVFVTYPAEKAVMLDDAQTLTNKTINGSSNTITNVSLASGVTGTLPIANGGSGATTAQNAMNAFAGAVTSGQYLRGNGTNVVMSAIQAADVPTLNQNTTGNAATATALQTARTINGVSFNGTGNITITAAANGGNAATVTTITTAQVLNATAGASVGTVGTYAFFNTVSNGVTFAEGSTIAGSSLRYGSALSRNTSTGDGHYNRTDQGSTPSGTWLAMGRYSQPSGTTSVYSGTSLFLRIS